MIILYFNVAVLLGPALIKLFINMPQSGCNSVWAFSFRLAHLKRVWASLIKLTVFFSQYICSTFSSTLLFFLFPKVLFSPHAYICNLIFYSSHVSVKACQRVMTEEVTSDNYGLPQRLVSVRAKGGGRLSALMEEGKMAMSVLSTYYVLNLDSCCRSCRPVISCH